MDFKTIRQTMTINQSVFSTSGEIPIDEDFILPDFYPEVIKILKCKAQARIASKSANGSAVAIDGHICINLLFCDKSGCLHNYEHILPFSKSFDADNDVSGGCVSCRIKSEYLNCRAVTERKISVHGAFSIALQVKSKKQHDVIVDIEDETVQINRKELPFLNAVGNAEKNLLIEQELELSAGQQSIDSILRCEAFPVITEIKAVRNKAAVKGNMTISVLYSSGKQCVPYKSTIPFSQFIDIQGINEECICTGKVQLCYLEVKPRNVDGQCRSMMLSAKLSISAETYCDGEVPVINDAYSTRYELDMQHTDANIERVIGHISDSFMFKKTFEFSGGAIGNIIDSWTETDIDSCTFDNGKIIVKGNITVCLLVFDSDSRACYHEKKTDFTYEKAVDYTCEGNLICTPVIEPITTSYAILSDSSLEYRVEHRINLSLCEEKKVSLLTDISSGNNATKSKIKDCSLILYCAQKGESVWNIAKKYNTNTKEMREINSLESDSIETSRKILIPLM